MRKLSQIISVEKQIKSQVEKELTANYHTAKGGNFLVGISRTFRHASEQKPGEARETPPDEKSQVQVKIEDMLKEVAKSVTKLLDITVTKDKANQGAKGTVFVDGTALLQDMPVTSLIFLEKRLVDLRTLVSSVPVLDTSENWHFDANKAVFASDPVETRSSKRVKKVLTLAPATAQHPAQTQAYDDDELVGYWKTIKFSGAIPKTRQLEILDRIEKLMKEVKYAREDANSCAAPEVNIGDRIFKFLFT